MRLFLVTSLLLLAAGCLGPLEGAPCDGDNDGAVCAGSEVMLCVCESPDAGGNCDGDATWQQDELCSCDVSGAMTCQ